MLGIDSKRTLLTLYRQIVIYPQSQLVEKDVTIRAQAKNVLRDVRPVVGTTEWLYMACFRVSAGRR